MAHKYVFENNNSSNIKEIFKYYGIIVLRNYFNKSITKKLKKQIYKIFNFQILNGKNNYSLKEHALYDSAITNLYLKNNDAFLTCAKMLQNIPYLHQISSSSKTINLLEKLGLKNPSICYTPLIMFNSIILNKYITPLHQDWRSMQGSLDSVVLWSPLLDVDNNFGNIEFIPGTHKLGLQHTDKDEWFRHISENNFQNNIISIKLFEGDLIVFSSFLIHKTGINHNNRIRWSMQFRYNNLSEETFIRRKYPYPYKHYPQQKLINKFDFNLLDNLLKVYE